MSVRRVVAILVLAILTVVMPSSASASITPTPETRIGNFKLHEPGLIGFVVSRTVENHRAKSILYADLASQHSLRWKGMWRFDFGGGTELYDARARMWSPQLGTFLSVDEFAFHDGRTTLWGWPKQNPISRRDPSGHIGTGDSPSSDRAIGANADWSSPAFQSTYNPAVEAGIGGFIVATFPALTYVLAGGMMVESERDLPLLALGGNPLKPMASAAEEAVCAASPVGRKGQPLGGFDPRNPTNVAGEVGGRQFSGHAFDRMQSQGIPPSAVENTIENGIDVSGKVPGTAAHYDPVNNMTVITDAATGRVVTVDYGAIRQ